METILIYVVAGIGAGLVSGLFGVGGGLTVVPALVLALPIEGVADRFVMHMAIGTSLAVMIFTAAVTTWWRHLRGDLDWSLFARFAPLVAVGGVIGAGIGDALDGRVLRFIFIGFVIFTIMRDLWRLLRRPAKNMAGGASSTGAAATGQASDTLAARASFGVHGLAAGIVGALLGAGAAIVTVPFLMGRGRSIQEASAQSAGLSALIGLAAGAGYAIAGLDETGLPPQAIGYLFVPAFLGVAAGALAGSPLGVKLSHVFSARMQAGLFVAYLSMVLAVMISRL